MSKVATTTAVEDIEEEDNNLVPNTDGESVQNQGMPSSSSSSEAEDQKWKVFLTKIDKLDHLDCILNSKVRYDDMVSIGKKSASVLSSLLKELDGIPLGDRVTIINGLLDAQYHHHCFANEIENKSENDKDTTTENILYLIPGINIIYDAIFDETPSLDSIKETLNLLGIIGALVYAVVVTLPLAFDYEVYEGVIERWGEGGIYGNCWINGYYQIEYFNQTTTWASTLTFVSVVLVILHYFALVNTRLKTQEELNIWWYWTRWIILLTFVALVTGIINGFRALQNLSEWNIPNQHAINQDCSEELKSANNPWGYNARFVFATMCCCLIPGLIILSCAIASKHRHCSKTTQE
jgi:hypothetical protein